jgi:hypothetical protein
VSEERKPYRATIRGFRFAWWGGEYLEIYGPGGGDTAFEVINMSPAEGNGNLPPFTREVFHSRLDELTDADFKEYRHSFRESQR